MQAVNVCEVGSRVPGCGTATGCRQQATGSGACVRIYMHPKNGREECTKESTGLHTRCLCVSARQHGLSVDGEATSECPVSQANCRRALQATMCQPSNPVLHHTVYCITMYCTVRHCIVLYCMVRYCTPLYCCIAVLLYCCTALYCCIAVLYCTVLHCYVPIIALSGTFSCTICITLLCPVSPHGVHQPYLEVFWHHAAQHIQLVQH